MKFSTTTTLLQTLVAKSMKGASCNKMIPLTCLMAIELKDDVLTLTTTDSTNYLYVKAENVIGDDFYVVVQAETFSKLISKLTCDMVDLILENDILTVKGNGKYNIELPLDEEGKLVVFPNPLKNKFVAVEEKSVPLSIFQVILETAKASLSSRLDVPCYTGYYVGNKTVTTDTYKMCGIKNNLFDEPVLINPLTMNLLSIFTEDTVEVKKDNQIIMFSSSDCIVYGKLMDCINDFQIDAINGLLEDDYDSYCKVSKSALLQLLDRLSLFVGIYDKNCINLTFNENGITVESKQANSTETIEYMSSSNFVPYTCSLDIEMFTSQVKANIIDAIELHYGKDNALKISNGDITQILALMTN